jgi:hypothetical protein
MLQCRNHKCSQVIRNKRNAVVAENMPYCSHNCFLVRDNDLERHEVHIQFLRTRIGVLRQMLKQLYYIHHPLKSKAVEERIEAYRQLLQLAYNEIRKV